MSDLQRGEIRFSVYPMECRRVRIEARTKCQDDTLWAVHKDVGPLITEYDVTGAIDLLLYRLVQRAQTESSDGIIKEG